MWTHRRSGGLAAALTVLLIVGAGVAALAGGGASRLVFRPAEKGEPIVIGHRGAAGYRPEHTLAGYELAARMGADYVEPDLVSTKDGALVAHHETKHPTYFSSIGLPLEPPLVRTLRRHGLDRRRAKVFVQSFETRNLRELDRQIDTKLVQLLGSKTSRPYDFEVAGDPRTYAELATPAGLREVARYAEGVGPSKDFIVPRDAAGASQAPTSFIADAHDAGLLVHPYTFRNENAFLPLELRSGADPAAYGNALAEYRQFYALGVDRLFADNADTAAEARSTPSPEENVPASSAGTLGASAIRTPASLARPAPG